MIRSSRTLKRSFTSLLSRSLVLILIANGLRRSNQLGDDELVIKQLRKLGCQRSAFPYRHGNLAGRNMENMTTRASADKNEEISIFFPHELEIKYEIFMTMFCENLITDGARDMAVKKIRGHDSVWEDKELGNSYHGARNFLNRSNYSHHRELCAPQSTIISRNSSYLMNSNRTDDLNSEKVTNYHHKLQRRPLIKSTKFLHTLEAYFTISKDVPLNQRYFLDTILLPISVLYCILDHHRRLATIST